MPRNSLEQEAMDRVRRMYAPFDSPRAGDRRREQPHADGRQKPPEHHEEHHDRHHGEHHQHEHQGENHDRHEEHHGESPREEKPVSSLLELFMKDKDQSLILLLLVLLMKDNADMNLMLALVYLLI